MTEIINFNKKRKAKAKADKEKTAAENRYKFGRTKEEKKKDKVSSERAEKHIEGHKREIDETEN